MESTPDSSIFPKNFRVRWILSGLTHRISAWEDFKSLWTSSILFWIVRGSSIARKDRSNQKTSSSSPFVSFLERGLGRIDSMLPQFKKKSIRKRLYRING